jgi:hypothetical protein
VDEEVIAFKDLRVVTFSIEYNDLFWEIQNTREDVQEYDFFVERSESEGGPWVAITPALVDRYYMRDNSAPLYSANRTLFYRVRAFHRFSGRELFSDISSRQGKLPLDGLEMVRLENMVFREHVGVTCWLFPKRTFGQRCPQCWDNALGKCTDDRCPTCFSTGFSGGYHFPIRFYGQLDVSDRSEQSTTSTHLETQYSTIRLGPFPDAKANDMIVDNTNWRWRVMSVGNTSRLGVPIRQQLSVVRVKPGSIEDLVPLNIDLENEVLVPAREFTNPQSPGAADNGDLSGILGAYGYSR